MALQLGPTGFAVRNNRALGQVATTGLKFGQQHRTLHSNVPVQIVGMPVDRRLLNALDVADQAGQLPPQVQSITLQPLRAEFHTQIKQPPISTTATPATTQAHVYLVPSGEDAQQRLVLNKPGVPSWEGLVQHVTGEIMTTLNQHAAASAIGDVLGTSAAEVKHGPIGATIHQGRQLFQTAKTSEQVHRQLALPNTPGEVRQTFERLLGRNPNS
jgi:hypothetical protein